MWHPSRKVATAGGRSGVNSGSGVPRFVVPVTDWLDLVDTIDTVCPGTPDSDPSGIDATLTCTKTTGTAVDGSVVNANVYGWTGVGNAAGANAGWRKSLGKISAIFPEYDPTKHRVEMRADFLATASAYIDQYVAIVFMPNGAVTNGGAQGVGWFLDAQARAVYAGNLTAMNRIIPPSGLDMVAPARANIRPMKIESGTVQMHLDLRVEGEGRFPITHAAYTSYFTNSFTVDDEIALFIGEQLTPLTAFTGFTVGFAIRLVEQIAHPFDEGIEGLFNP